MAGGNCGCGSTRSNVTAVRILPLDQKRAGGIYFASSPLVTIAADAVDVNGDKPLVVDLHQPGGALVRKHWIAEHISFVGRLTARPPTQGTPVNGLFLCPPGTVPVEDFVLASTLLGFGMVPEARPLVLPITERACPSEALNNGQWMINYTVVPGFKTTIPAGWFLRAIVNCGPATPTPGPGINSTGIINATVVVEDDV